MNKFNGNGEKLDRQEYAEAVSSSATDHYIIGIGASAGGLEAINELFDNVPQHSNLSFIIVQHLSPDYKSLMADLLTKHTKMQVLEAEDGMQVEVNCVYVIPSRKNMTVKDGKISLIEKSSYTAPNNAIDIFLKSLAEDKGNKAVGIILSGTGSDGTKGAEAIRKSGGIVIVQDPLTAKFDGMPNSAITMGAADFILAPELMPEQIIMHINNSEDEAILPHQFQGEEEQVFMEVLELIRNSTGLDFTYYKRPTITRRIMRRLAFSNFKNIEEYRSYLIDNPEEIAILCKEFLINVTKFFRDAEAFEVIEKIVVPAIADKKVFNDSIKVWVPGCSTGEEAYSLAMIFCEYLEKVNKEIPVKIFATDIDREALDTAAKGCYPEAIEKDIKQGRLEKYFVKEGKNYKVSARIRKMVIFANHDIIKDPPFTRIDLISCRNLLIYLTPILQKRILSRFHFSLSVGGYLFLGLSETPGDLKSSLSDINKKWKIYKNIEASRNISYELFSSNTAVDIKVQQYHLKNTKSSKDAFQQALTEMLNDTIMEEFGYAGVYVDENMELVQAIGDFKRFLQLPDKRLSLNLLKMVSEDVSIPLSSAIRKSFRENEKVVLKGIRLKDKKINRYINIVVKPVPISGKLYQKLSLILFQEQRKEKITVKDIENLDVQAKDKERLADMEQELKDTRESLQTAIEELETSNEELQSTNEELLSANEELQSTNEELQSLNEELHTVNTEHQLKIRELIEANDDLINYFRSSEISQIYLDKDLIIRKFTPVATEQINLIESDIGRPITHISSNIKYDSLVKDIVYVVRTSATVESKVQSLSGNWYQMRIVPYLKQDKQSEGAIITFIDITQLKKAEEILISTNQILEQKVKERTNELAVSEQRFRLLSITTNDAVWDWNLQTGKLWWNEGFRTLFGHKEEEAESGIELLEKRIHPDDRERVMTKLNEVISKGLEEWSDEYRFMRSDGTYRYIIGKGFFVSDENKRPFRMLGSMIDVTPLKIAQEELRRTNTNLIKINAELDNFVYTASHDLKAPVANIEGLITSLEAEVKNENENATFILGLVKECIERFKTTIKDLTEISRLQKNIEEDISEVEVQQVFDDVKLSISSLITASEADVTLECKGCESVKFSKKNLRSIIYNFMSNAIKYRYSTRKPEVKVKFERVNGEVLLTVADNGLGIEEDKKDKIFKMFKRFHDHVEGSGVGLYIVKRIVDNVDGRVEVKSELGKGTTFFVWFKE